MSRETTDSGNQGDWENLLATMAAHMDVFAHLEPFRAQLATQRDRAREVRQQQAALIASKQELSKQLRVIITEGNRLATLLRSAIKQHYGIRAEKVAEFGVQPFRGKNKKKTAPPPVPASIST